MKYAKPEVVVHNSAFAAIQHIGKGQPFVLDSATSGPNVGMYNATNNAYEADE
jgi:hypothetical protein